MIGEGVPSTAGAVGGELLLGGEQARCAAFDASIACCSSSPETGRSPEVLAAREIRSAPRSGPSALAVAAASSCELVAKRLPHIAHRAREPAPPPDRSATLASA